VCCLGLKKIYVMNMNSKDNKGSNKAIDIKDAINGCLIGLAVGDAVGTTLEFKPRGTFQPITDMTGSGPFRLKAGEWTDDTSMALCLAQSLHSRI